MVCVFSGDPGTSARVGKSLKAKGLGFGVWGLGFGV